MTRPREKLPDESEDEPDAGENALAALRRLVDTRTWPEGDRDRDRSCLPFGIDEIDAHLPHGGLGLGSLHEIAPDAEADAPAALGFTLALVARHLARAEGEAVLIMGRGHPTPYGHGLADLGLDPGRLMLFEVGSDVEAFRAVEESLRARGLRAVAGLVDAGLPLKQSRRLHLAAGRTEVLLLVLRPARGAQANVAATRWRIASATAARDRFGCIARARWRVHLDRCRNGRIGHWLLEWDHAAHRFGLAGALADHAPEAGARNE